MTYRRTSPALRSLALALGLAACGGGTSGGPPDLGTPAGQWTYVPIDGTQCMDGSATGIGVNLGTSGDLVVYMEGGGACFNDSTCGSASHQDGWGPTDFEANITPYNIGIFDRMDYSNPLRDATFVFVPYCTGDVHAGSNPTGYTYKGTPLVQVGFENVGKDLDYVIPKATDVTRVILAGSSAGGFGALFNYDRTQTAFGDTPVLLLDDSGPPLSDTYLTPCLQQKIRDYWNIAPALPADCTTCNQSDGGGLGNAAGFLADKYPDRRMGLVTSTRDGVIRSFLGFGYPDCTSGGNPIPEPDYAAGIAELRDQTLASHPNFRVFSKDSGLHVWLLSDPLSSVTSGSSDLSTWLTDMLDPGASFDSVAP
jgi:Pectinacetylesterase